MTRDFHALPTTVVPSRRREIAIDLVLFALVGIAIVIAAWSGIAVRNVEIGDFAANGLLIQDAKRLALLTGNYSRIGVHHPGPAILYVLALGELLLHDVLHLVKSPFSGQIVAGCFYTAAWIVVILRECRKLCGSWLGGAFMASVFLVVMAFFDYNFFADIWFPNLYVFPFAAMTLALARLASGRTDSLVALAVSAGFLINGHVSFVATLGIMFIVAVVANSIGFWRTPERRIVGAVFLRLHRRRIAIALAVLALFFVPLAIVVVTAFPGPISGYVHFGGDRVVHVLRDSLFYVTDFWGGLGPVLGSLAAAALVVAASRGLASGRAGVVSLVVVLIASSLALFVYARYGIDYLELKYVGYYYYTTPALLFSVVAFVALGTGGGARRKAVAIVVIGCCLFVTYWKIYRPVHDMDQYNEPGVVSLYDVLRSASTGGRVVLNLDNRQEWGHLWTHLVGAEAIATRRHEDLFCVNRNWHILFTAAARCTPEEMRTRPRFNVRAERGPRSEPVAFEALGIGFTPYQLPDITDAGYQSVKEQGNRFVDYFLASGWSAPEGEHVWSNDRESHLAFRVRPGFSGVLELDSGALLVPGHMKVTGSTFVNGVAASRFEFTGEHARQMLAVPIRADAGNADVDVKVIVDNPTSPLLAGAGDDPRVLGISLFGLQVKAQ